MTSSLLFKLALLFTGLGLMLGLLLARHWRPMLNKGDRLLPPRHLRRAGVRYRSDKPDQGRLQ